MIHPVRGRGRWIPGCVLAAPLPSARPRRRRLVDLVRPGLVPQRRLRLVKVRSRSDPASLPAGLSAAGGTLHPGCCPLQAFAVPDLLCLLISLWLFSALAIRTLPKDAPLPAAARRRRVRRRPRSVRPRCATSGSFPGRRPARSRSSIGALLAAVCFIERPDRVSLVFWIGLAGGVRRRVQASRRRARHARIGHQAVPPR